MPPEPVVLSDAIMINLADEVANFANSGEMKRKLQDLSGRMLINRSFWIDFVNSSKEFSSWQPDAIREFMVKSLMMEFHDMYANSSFCRKIFRNNLPFYQKCFDDLYNITNVTDAGRKKRPLDAEVNSLIKEESSEINGQSAGFQPNLDAGNENVEDNELMHHAVPGVASVANESNHSLAFNQGPAEQNARPVSNDGSSVSQAEGNLSGFSTSPLAGQSSDRKNVLVQTKLEDILISEESRGLPVLVNIMMRLYAAENYLEESPVLSIDDMVKIKLLFTAFVEEDTVGLMFCNNLNVHKSLTLQQITYATICFFKRIKAKVRFATTENRNLPIRISELVNLALESLKKLPIRLTVDDDNELDLQVHGLNTRMFRIECSCEELFEDTTSLLNHLKDICIRIHQGHQNEHENVHKNGNIFLTVVESCFYCDQYFPIDTLMKHLMQVHSREYRYFLQNDLNLINMAKKPEVERRNDSESLVVANLQSLNEYDAQVAELMSRLHNFGPYRLPFITREDLKFLCTGCKRVYKTPIDFIQHLLFAPERANILPTANSSATEMVNLTSNDLKTRCLTMLVMVTCKECPKTLHFEEFVHHMIDKGTKCRMIRLVSSMQLAANNLSDQNAGPSNSAPAQRFNYVPINNPRPNVSNPIRPESLQHVPFVNTRPTFRSTLMPQHQQQPTRFATRVTNMTFDPRRVFHQ